MNVDEKSADENIVHAPAQALSVRSAALVARGLRNLAFNSNWITRKLFVGNSLRSSISPSGQVCAASASAPKEAPRVTVYDIEASSTLPFELGAPSQSERSSSGSPAAFAWSPIARYLVAASDGLDAKFQLFDLNEKTDVSTFGDCSASPNSLAWSDGGCFFAAASGRCKKSSLRVWKVAANGTPLSDSSESTLASLSGIERQTYEAEFGEEGALSGYGKIVFSPDEKLLAATLEFKGDWADDSILLADVPSLQTRKIFQAQGHITDLSWTPDGKRVIYCAAGQAHSLDLDTTTSEEMPFAAELCMCHPFLPLCVCFSSWLKHSAKGQLYIFDSNRQEVFDECPAEGIVALRWSGDGSKAYAIAEDGLAYVYESPIV